MNRIKKMGSKKLISSFIILSFISGSNLPAFADSMQKSEETNKPDREIMVLPPVEGFSKLPKNSSSEVYSEYKANTEISDAGSSTSYSYANRQASLKGTITTVPVGTSFEVITNSDISTEQNKVGEYITATLNQPVSVGYDTVIPAGSEIYGQITYSEDAGRAGRNAYMEVKFTAVKSPEGNKIPMMGKILTKDNTGVLRGGSVKQQLVKNTSAVAVTTTTGLAAGAGIGAIAGGAGTGAIIGSSVGGVVGLGYVIARKGREVEVPAGTKMIVSLEQPLTVGQ